MKKSWIGLMILTLCFGGKVYLKDGNVITGSIAKYDSTGVVVKTSFGEVTITPDNIAKIDFEDIVTLFPSAVVKNITTVTTLVIASANIILVIVTYVYAHQTKRMVDYYYESQKIAVKSFFIPADNFLHSFVIGQAGFNFINAGNDALFIEIHIDDQSIRNLQSRVPGSHPITTEVYNWSKYQSASGQFTVTLTYYDKMMNKYKQELQFIIEKLSFIVDKTIIPMEVKS